MANKIQIRRGLLTNLPTLDAGEPAWTTDTEALYIGNPTGSGNVLVTGGAGGGVGKTGTPAANQIAYWSTVDDITGTAGFTWDAALGELLVEGPPLTVSDTDQYNVFFRRTLNDPTAESGTQEFRLIKGDVSVVSSTGWDSVYLMDLQVDGVSKFSVDTTGIVTTGLNVPSGSAVTFGSNFQLDSTAVNELRFENLGTNEDFKITMAPLNTITFGSNTGVGNMDLRAFTVNTANVTGNTTGYIGIRQRSLIRSDLDGDFKLTNQAGTDFGMLQFGGTTAAYPALKRDSNDLHVRLADDSSYAKIYAQQFVANAPLGGSFSFLSSSRIYAPVDGQIMLRNFLGTDFDMLQFGGTTASFPALKRSGTDLELKLADDADYSNLTLRYVLAQLGYRTDGTFGYYMSNHAAALRWPNLRLVRGDAGVLVLDDAASDFGRLCFGGSTSLYPALKRSGVALHCRLADDSGPADLAGRNIWGSGYIWAGGTQQLGWSARNKMTADVTGSIVVTDSSGTDMNMIKFGGTTASYPAWQRSGTSFNARLADNSGFAAIVCEFVTINHNNGLHFWNRSQIWGAVDGNITLYNNALSDFGLLQFGGTSALFPALKRNAVGIECVKADDSGDAALKCGTFQAVSYSTMPQLRLQGGGITRINMYGGGADGVLKIADSTGADMDRVCWGGTTLAYPALKRSATALHCRLADDSDYADLVAGEVLGAFGLRASSGQPISWSTRTVMYSLADGNLTLRDSAGTSFGLLQFGGTTSLYPAWKMNQSPAAMYARLADDTADAAIIGGMIQANNQFRAPLGVPYRWWPGSKMNCTVNGDITVADSAGTDFGLLQFGGTTSAFPAWKRVGATLVARLADDTLDATIQGSTLYGSIGVQVHQERAFYWTGRSGLRCSADGNIHLTDSIGTDFGLLQFGGTTASFPALKRSATILEARLADDSGYTNIKVNRLLTDDYVRIAGASALSWASRIYMYATAADELRFGNQGSTTAAHLILNEYASAADPAVASADTVRFYARDDGSLKGELCARFPTGNVRVIAAETGLPSVDLSASSALTFDGQFQIDSPGVGQLRLTGLGGLNNEDLTFDHEATAQRIVVSSSTGASILQLQAIGLVTTGSVQAGYTVQAGGASSLRWQARSQMFSPVDGNVQLTDDAGTDFGMLQLGGTTAAYPAIVRDGQALKFKLADDSAYASLLADGLSIMSGAATFSWYARSRMYSYVDGVIHLTNWAGTGFTRLCLGGTTASEVAIQPRVGGLDELEVVKGDGSVKARLSCAAFNASGLATVNGLQINSGQKLQFHTSSKLFSNVDGNLQLLDSAETDFGLLQFGGTTAAYPALRRAGTGLQVRLADDSTYSSLLVSALVATGGVQAGAASFHNWGTRSRMYSDADGNIRLTDNSTADFGLLQFGGTTSAYPALKRNSYNIQAVKADESGRCGFSCSHLDTSSIILSTTNSYYWNARSRIYSDADGSIRLSTNAGGDFTSLLWGGTTASFPGLFRNATALECKLADDTAFTGLSAGQLTLAPATLTVSDTSDYAFQVTQTLNDTTSEIGTQAYNMIRADLTITDRTGWDAVYLMNLAAGGVSQFSIDTGGNVLAESYAADTYVRVNGAGKFYWNGRSAIFSEADGNIRLADNAGTDFGLLQFGGTTSAYPALKRDTNRLLCYLADDSGLAPFFAGNIQATGYFRVSGSYSVHWFGKSAIRSDADGDLRLTDWAGTDFGFLQFGGTTSAYPALKRASANLSAWKADGSGQTGFSALEFTASGTGGLYCSSSGATIRWPDVALRRNGAGVLQIDDVSSGFDRLQFGGATNAYPAIKRVGSGLSVVRADDSGGATLTAGILSGTSYVGTAVAGYFGWNGRSRLYSPADGNIQLTNAAVDDFGLLQFGGTTASFPALKRSGVTLQARLADDSAAAYLQAGRLYSDTIIELGSASYLNWNGRSRIFSGANGNVQLGDASGTDFGLLQLGGTTAAYPALKRSTDRLHVKYADDSGYAGINSRDISVSQGVSLTTALAWGGKTQITSPSNGRLLLQDAAASLGTTLSILAGGPGSLSILDQAGTAFGRFLAGQSAIAPGDLTSATSNDFALRIVQTLNDPTPDTGTQEYRFLRGDLTLTDTSGWDSVYLVDLQVDGASTFLVGTTGAIEIAGQVKVDSPDVGQLRMTGLGGTHNESLTFDYDSFSNIVDVSSDTSVATVRFSGITLSAGNVFAGQNYTLGILNHISMTAPAIGDLTLADNAGTDFGLLQFGGTTSAFPALKRSGGNLLVQKADDSGLTGLSCSTATITNATLNSVGILQWNARFKLDTPAAGQLRLTGLGGINNEDLTIDCETTANTITVTSSTGATQIAATSISGYFSGLKASSAGAFGWHNRSQMKSPVDGNVLLQDIAGTDFGLLQFGGTTSAYPALQRNGAQLRARLADDSDYAPFVAASITVGQGGAAVSVSSTGQYKWNARSEMRSPADGDICMYDFAVSDFNMLQFGGTTASYPAWKKATAPIRLEARYADDSNYCPIHASMVTATQAFRTGTTGALQFYADSQIRNEGAGIIRITNNAADDFDRLQFGGTTSSFPAWKRNGTALHARLADDSTYTSINVNSLYAAQHVLAGVSYQVGWTTRSRMYSDADGDIRLVDAAGTDFGLLKFGGTTSSFPALKRDSANLQARLADDSDYASFAAATITGTGAIVAGLYVRAGANSSLNWSTRSSLRSDADGDIRLNNNAQNDFGMLKFGGTTSAYPALKRNGTGLEVKLADDSAYATLTANRLNSLDLIRIGANPYGYIRAATGDGNLRLTNNADDDFGLLIFGSQTASFPAWKRDGTKLVARTADDSGDCQIQGSIVISSGRHDTAAAGEFAWTTRSRMRSPADGNLTLYDSAVTDFGLLQFGGTTSSYPAWKRSSTTLEARLADDSAYASVNVLSLTSYGGSVTWNTTGVFINGATANVLQLARSAGAGDVCLEMREFNSGSDPAAPSASRVRFYVRDNGSGTGELCARFPTGNIRVLTAESSYVLTAASREVEANTAGSASPNALTTDESFKVLTNEAATERNYHALPVAAAGLQYTFCVQDNDGLRVVAQTGDTIRHAASVSSSGGYIESTTVGDVLTVVAINSTEWFVTHVVGSGWTTA